MIEDQAATGQGWGSSARSRALRTCTGSLPLRAGIAARGQALCFHDRQEQNRRDDIVHAMSSTRPPTTSGSCSAATTSPFPAPARRPHQWHEDADDTTIGQLPRPPQRLYGAVALSGGWVTGRNSTSAAVTTAGASPSSAAGRDSAIGASQSACPVWAPRPVAPPGGGAGTARSSQGRRKAAGRAGTSNQRLPDRTVPTAALPRYDQHLGNKEIRGWAPRSVHGCSVGKAANAKQAGMGTCDEGAVLGDAGLDPQAWAGHAAIRN